MQESPNNQYMDIRQNIQEILSDLPPTVRLVAVSKFHPIEAIREAYEGGQRIFGESKVQELTHKQEALPDDIEWHFIGHLQTNKVKYIAPYVSLIHGVDSFRLLAEINRQSERVGRVIPCLLQLHVAQESTKFGFTPEECHDMLQAGEWRNFSNISIRGVMGMASFTDDANQIRQEFALIRHTFNRIKEDFFATDASFGELSMGMSDDYPIAIEEGSTLIRIGSSIFGHRNY